MTILKFNYFLKFSQILILYFVIVIIFFSRILLFLLKFIKVKIKRISKLIVSFKKY